MVRLYKKEVTPEKLAYYYQPEGKGENGIISYDIKADDIKVEKLAEGDKQGRTFYTNHCLRAFREFVKNNDFPEETMRAWY
jgi:hypothetical protein